MNGDALDEAVRLLAGGGDLDRVEALHRQRPDGRCTACGPLVTWPCLHITLIGRARRLRAGRRAATVDTGPSGAGSSGAGLSDTAAGQR